ncbi:MAG: fumarylacetoacetate hydrolase family protein [Clostridia bacterium]|jgi:2-keto-4-pentenoate hydratase/2-oxohepta-3-ene-1,7-dioic acid hydratase in catechol pathway|nr:fumarylacetoacetate hydrolase family protein [Clostridia bacterium]MBT7122160.1 fumarylacetoacetate hydrolase family protein [Clostridia bacterium]
MKVVRYRKDGQDNYGVLEGQTVKAIAGKPYERIAYTGDTVPLSEVKLLAPCEPEKIIAVGLNYLSHAKEINMEIPDVPLLFFKPPSAIINPGEPIVRPVQSAQVEYEAELAVVIKKHGKYIPQEDAQDYIFGFTCLNDVTARDLQFIESQWARSKGFDTFCPFGPHIETDYDYKGKQIKAVLNEEVKQDANTDDFINSVEMLVSYISTIMTLKPGDVISTGTAGGIGPMESGDMIRVEIEGIGVLENEVIDF